MRPSAARSTPFSAASCSLVRRLSPSHAEIERSSSWDFCAARAPLSRPRPGAVSGERSSVWTMILSNTTLSWAGAPAAGGVDGPPPANCQPVAGAQLNGLNWDRGVVVNEIQSVDNGNG